MVTIVLTVDPDGPEAWEESRPIRDEDKEKYRGDKREKLSRLLLVLSDALHEIEERFKDNLDHVLHASWHKRAIFGRPSDDPDKERTHDDANEKSVGHRHRPDTKQFFRSN